MPFLEALMITFGYSRYRRLWCPNSSIDGYSPYIQWVVAIFMILFGVNFNAYYFILLKRFRQAFDMEKLRILLIIAASRFLSIFMTKMTAADTLRPCGVQVGSLDDFLTDYSTVDFFMLQCIQGCADYYLFIGGLRRK